jgi:hypothetical protein
MNCIFSCDFSYRYILCNPASADIYTKEINHETHIPDFIFGKQLACF